MVTMRAGRHLAVAMGCLVAAWLLHGSALWGQGGGSVPPEAEQAALAIAAAQAGVPESELVVLTAASVELPELGLVVYDFKIGHEPTDTVVHVTVDGQGAEQSLDALFTAALDSAQAQYGALEPEFHAELQAMPPSQLVPVEVWVGEPFPESPYPRPDSEAPLSEADAEAAIEQNDIAREQAVAQAVAPVVAQLQSMGFAVETDSLAPVVAADLPAGVILNDVSRWAEVLEVHDGREPMDPFLEVQLPACQTNVVHNQGITGTGSRVAVVEVGGRINVLNPFLAGVTQDLVFSCLSGHTTAVAGIVRSTDATRLGHAYTSTLWVGGSCGGVTRQLRNRSNAASRNFRAQAFNLSFGSRFPTGRLGALDRYYDGLVLNSWRTVVPAAGNGGAGAFVGSPGTAYNVVTVGSYDDRNTTFWPDDVISGFSSSVDPLSLNGDREKPEVAAPGSNINSTTNAAPWTGAVGSGTSFAAPAVTGISALLMQRNVALRVWPEAVKSILMSSAEHNIEGAARLSERDGAGGVVADRADQVARRVANTGNWAGIGYNCASPATLNLTAVNLTAGQRIRFTMAWDTNPTARGYRRRPVADLDLWVRRPGGAVVATSLSWDNTYEIVDFIAPVNGAYTFQARKFRCSSSPRWLGWAWHVVP